MKKCVLSAAVLALLVPAVYAMDGAAEPVVEVEVPAVETPVEVEVEVTVASEEAPVTDDVKVEVEAVEYEEDRPRGRINDGRRHWREEGEVGDPRDVLDAPAPRQPRPQREYRPAAAPRDPFFDQPYQPPATDAAPAWEAAAKPAGTRISANIKPKRKVAALFKAD